MPGLPQADPQVGAIPSDRLGFERGERSNPGPGPGLADSSVRFLRSEPGRRRSFVTNSGVYAPGGEFLIRQRVKHLLLEHHKAEKWTRKLAREVTEFILLDTPELEATPSSDFINLENGILDVWTGELLPHSPKVLSTIRIPIAFDAQASCPRIEQFIEDVFPKDSTELAWEILGDLVTPDRSIQKAVCLVGEGGNGKGCLRPSCRSLRRPEQCFASQPTED